MIELSKRRLHSKYQYNSCIVFKAIRSATNNISFPLFSKSTVVVASFSMIDFVCLVYLERIVCQITFFTCSGICLDTHSKGFFHINYLAILHLIRIKPSYHKYSSHYICTILAIVRLRQSLARTQESINCHCTFSDQLFLFQRYKIGDSSIEKDRQKVLWSDFQNLARSIFSYGDFMPLEAHCRQLFCHY